MKNIVAKEEIARFVQFLLLSLYFQKAAAAEASESVYMRERVNRKACMKRRQMVILNALLKSVMVIYKKTYKFCTIIDGLNFLIFFFVEGYRQLSPSMMIKKF